MSADPVWDLVREQDPRHRPFLDTAFAGLEAAEQAALDAYLAHLRAEGLTDQRIVDCYLTLVGDMLREQIYFRRHKHYRHSTYVEVAASVYDDPDYMTRYMVGLGLSTYVWPNHVAMRRFAEGAMPVGSGRGFLEVGPGHGLFFLHALGLGGFSRYVGVDISATSLALTRALLERRGEVPDSLDLRHADFLDCALSGGWDALVLGEVIEHVERPGAFLERAASLADADTWIHVTTCINSPAVDHITLFRDEATIEALFADAGLRIEDRLALGHAGTTLAESHARALPVNVAYVLRRAP